MSGRAWGVLVLWLASFSAHAEIFRCAQAGRVVFTDRACYAGAEPETIRMPSTIDTKAGLELARMYDARIARERAQRDAGYAERAQAWEARNAKAERVRRGRVTRRVVRGMSMADVRSVLGFADEVRRDDDERGEREQWVYVQDDGTRQTVSFSDGEVSTVSGGRSRSKKKR